MLHNDKKFIDNYKREGRLIHCIGSLLYKDVK